MQVSKRTLGVIGVCAVAIGVSSLTMVRGSRLATAGVQEREQDRIEARDRITHATCVTLSESAVALEPALGVVLAGESDPDTAARKASAIRFTQAFLTDRFVGATMGQGEAYQEYVAAQLRRGFRMKPLEEFAGFGLPAYYKSLTGKTLDAESDLLAAFAEIAAAEDSRGNQVSLPTHIAVDPPLIGVAIGEASLANPDWPDAGGFIGRAMMNASGRSNNKSYWRHPEDLQSQLAGNGIAQVAQVQCVLEFRPGDRRICLFNLVWAPRLGEWILDSTACSSESEDRDTWIKWQY